MKRLGELMTILADKYGKKSAETFSERLDTRLKAMKLDTSEKVPVWILEFLQCIIEEQEVSYAKIEATAEKSSAFGLLFNINQYVEVDMEFTGEEITMIFGGDLEVFVSTENRYYEIHKLGKGTIETSKLYPQLLQLAQKFPINEQGDNIQSRIQADLEKYDLVANENVPDFLFTFFESIINGKSIQQSFNSELIDRYTWLSLLENLDDLISCKFTLENQNQMMNYILEFDNRVKGVVDLRNDEIRVHV